MSRAPQPSERELGFREGIEAAAKACDGEHLVEPQAHDDLAYDRAVADCITAIRALSPTPQPSEGERELAEALEPLARGCEQVERDYGDDLPGHQYQFPRITMDDLRLARAALAKFNGGDK